MFGNLKSYAFAAAVLAALPMPAAWAKGPDMSYAALHASEPALAPDQGRIYLYREGGLMGAAIQPTIMIDGQSAGGRAKPGDYFYIDRPAGTYKISTETEVEKAVSVTLAAGQSLYVRFDVSMGFLMGRVRPSIIDPQQALAEISDCDYHAPKPAEPPKTEPTPAPAEPAAAEPAPATTPSN